MAEGVDKSLVMALPKKGNLKRCQNYHAISLISHPNKIMLRVILNRLNANAEELLAGEKTKIRIFATSRLQSRPEHGRTDRQ